ncbi:hypothetical protein SeF1_071 [Salmonella phage SeF1]|nr:hypothetical protein SeF1_071 [Salmonella phage SeF1]
MRRKPLPKVGGSWLTPEFRRLKITAVVRERHSMPQLDVKAVWCLHFNDGTYEYVDEDEFYDRP